ncbi:hypothetical protein CXB51_002560 [Gossypium anomalum]|uniref:Leucine-rich repeat-containing N-terminal plant-type domain-containing protein n=1 Tax=Gossypium anomalum TaxID=47600 RepID=A0A8J6DFD3_9ROSI|nr:hypothetical protein CXB51_002560 [Gossypium anomalum]
MTLLFSWLLFNSFFAIFFSISNLVLVSGQCQSHQRQFSFRSTTFATPLGRLMKWNQTKDCCSWEGVSYDADGHVIGLDLSIRGISCPIDVSSSLFRFQHLQRLNLAFNWFKTSFPTGFDKLENLSYLNLSYSDFKRQIPVEISRLTRLVTLDLSAFQISQTSLKLEKPNLEMLVQNLTRLRFLYLDGITISATGNELCRALLPFTKLQVLSMSDCYLSGPIPSFSSFKNLRELNLGDNQLSGTIHSTDWSGLSKLQIVDLSNNKLSGTIPPTLFGIQSLRRLFLSQNQFNGSIGDLHGKASSLLEFPGFLKNQYSLNYLDLSNNQIHGQIPNWIWKSINLWYLNISENLPMKNINSGIWILDLHGNQLQGQVPILPSYATYLDYSDNNFSFVLPAHIGDSLQFASFFSLSNNNIQGRIPESLCNHTKFQVTNSQSQSKPIGRKLSKIIGNCKMLEVLDIGNNQINDSFPCHLKNITMLRVLVLRSNNFTVTLIAPEIIIFDLASNNFRGKLHLTCLGTWKAMQPTPDKNQSEPKHLQFEDFGGGVKYQDAITITIKDSPSDSETGSIIGWNHLSVEIGFIFGLGIIIVPLIYWKRWRIWYFERIDRALSRLFPRLGRETKKHGRRAKQNQRRRTQQQLGLRIFFSISNLVLVSGQCQRQIPVEISRLTRLVTLDLSVILFQRSLELEMLVQNLTRLRFLYLDGVNISATGNKWCRALSPLTQLQVLSMSDCCLSGPMASSLSKLRSLSVIRLDHNNLSGLVPPFLAEFPNLTSLHLNDNDLSGRLPEEIFQIPTLQALDLSNNEVLEGSIKKFPINASLQTLRLAHTHIGGQIPESIGNLGQLTSIELAFCNFSGPIPKTVKKLSQLVYLNFCSNSFSGPIPNFSSSRNLTELNLAGNQLNGTIHSTDWSGLSKLVRVDLQTNKLSGTIPPTLFCIPSLQALVLSENQFDGSIVDLHGKASLLLRYLDLRSNKIQGQFPVSLFEFHGLEYLSLSSNNFSGLIPMSAFQNLRNLSYLDLSYNRLSIDATTTNISSLSFPTFNILGLGSCNLTEFPDFLKNQTSLNYLDLSKNQIHGGIPNWIWKAKNNSGWKMLQIFDLASNNFSGKLHLTCLGTWDAMQPNPDKNQSELKDLRFEGEALDPFYYQDSIIGFALGSEFPLHFLSFGRDGGNGILSAWIVLFPGFSLVCLLKPESMGGELTGTKGGTSKELGSSPASTQLMEDSMTNLATINDMFSSLIVLFQSKASKDQSDNAPKHNPDKGLPELIYSVLVNYRFLNVQYYEATISCFALGSEFPLHFLSFGRDGGHGILSAWIVLFPGFSLKAWEESYPEPKEALAKNCNAHRKGVMREPAGLHCNGMCSKHPIFQLYWYLSLLILMRMSLFSLLFLNSFVLVMLIVDVVLVSAQCRSDQRQIPIEISRLTRLVTLDLSVSVYLGRPLKLEKPNLEMLVQNLTRLRFLYLDGVNISATGNVWCKALLPLTELQELSMSNCYLSGPIHSSLSHLRSLSVVRLDNNNLSASVPQFFTEFENLTSLRLSATGLNGRLPEEIFQVSTLQILDLSTNKLLEGSFPNFPLKASLRTLALSGTNFGGQVPKSIGNLEQLTRIELASCNFSGAIPKTMKKLTQLVYLDFSFNRFSGPIPSFSSSRNLTQLNLAHNQLKGTIDSTNWSGLSKLVSVDLQNNTLSGTIPPKLFCIPSLRRLFLSQNQFKGNLGDLHGRASSLLDTFDLSSNNGKLHQKCLATWKGMQVLENEDQSKVKHLQFQFLEFYPNHYQDAITVTIKGLEWELVKILTVFTTIDISCNNFEGPIPEVIGTFKELYGLNFSHNAFTGSMPSFLGNLQQLESLDLSSNYLSGGIPLQLVNLNFLSFLNVSNNKLVGQIPTGTQLQTFSKASFENNPGLCGPPLTVKCANVFRPTTHTVPELQSLDGLDWLFIFIGVGFGAGGAAFAVPLLLWKTASKWVDDNVDKILEIIRPKVGLTYRRPSDLKVEADENPEEDKTETDDDDEEDEIEESKETTEEFRGRYCVFCSKLDNNTMKKVIHDLCCTCYDSPYLSPSTSTSSSFSP